MYERFYNLRERPFALSPDPEYLYLSRVHREALDSIRYGIESRAGFIVITGEIGAGKTTLLQTVLGRLDDRAVVARLVNTTLDPRELLEAVLIEFGLDTTGRSKPALLRDLGQFLVRQRAEGRRPLLVIDEAQNLGAAALEEVRLLSNLETEKSKLLQILLAGQPNLRDTIASPELEQFRQRVAVSYHLTPLDREETAAYINSRLAHAAIGVPPRFPRDAADLVHQRSGGVPRIINVICDAALVFGYAEERHDIDLSLIREVVAELETTAVLPPQPAIAAPAPAPAREPAAAVPAAVRGTGTAAPPHVAPAQPAQPQAVPALAAPPHVAPHVAASQVAASPQIAASAQIAAPAPGASPAQIAAPAQPAAPAIAAQRQMAPPLAATCTERPQAPGHTLQDATRSLSAIEGREQALAARERELAEQRRVLAEECRLLRERRLAAAVASAPMAATPAARVAAPVRRAAAPAQRMPVGAPRMQGRPVPRPAPMRFRPSRMDGARAWFRRVVTFWSNRALHGTRSAHGS